MSKKRKGLLICFISAMIVALLYFGCKAIQTHQVTYDLDGGKIVTSNPVSSIRWIDEAKLPKAKKLHYHFDGWNDGKETVKELKHVSSDITLTAMWTPDVYQIVYKDEDKRISVDKYEYNTPKKLLAKLPDDVMKKHPYENFVGWKVDKDIVTEIPAGEHDSKFATAVFEGKKYKITYELDGSTAENLPDSYQYGKGIDTLPIPEKDGYIFDGWYTDSDHTRQITSVSSNTHDDIKLYAVFHEQPVAVSQYTNVVSNNPYTPTSSANTISGNYVSIPVIGYTMNLSDDLNMFDSPEWASIDWNWCYEVADNDDGTSTDLFMARLDDHAGDGLYHLGERVPIGSQIIIGWNGQTYYYTVTNSVITECQMGSGNSPVRGAGGATLDDLGTLRGHRLAIRACTDDNIGNYVLICD